MLGGLDACEPSKLTRRLPLPDADFTELMDMLVSGDEGMCMDRSRRGVFFVVLAM